MSLAGHDDYAGNAGSNGIRRRVDCPLCNGRKTVAFRPGKFLKELPHCFKCGNFRELLNVFQTGKVEGVPRKRNNVDEYSRFKSKQHALEDLWAGSAPVIPGDAVDTYLRNRSIEMDTYPQDLHCHPSAEYWDKQNGEWMLLGKFPAMIALIRDPRGNAVSIHRTYLYEGRRADKTSPQMVPDAKKFMPFLLDGVGRGAAIRLSRVSETLAVSEGIENALSWTALTGTPAWAARDANSLANFDPPAEVQEVIIAADNDEHRKGLTCARRLAERLHFKGLKVKIAVPPIQGKDWNDMLRGNDES